MRRSANKPIDVREWISSNENADRGTSSVTAKTATVLKFTCEGLDSYFADDGALIIEDGCCQDPA